MRFLAALGVTAVLAASAARADVAVPDLRARVTDLTGTLSGEQRDALERKLANFESSKGSQIAVLLVPTTEPETIEQYGIRVAEAWKIGRKGVDDGAILIVAKNDHRLRIEVGYGLEGALNDATAKRIISETITPSFKQGRFYEGIAAGVDQMMGVIQGEPLPEPAARTRGSADDWGGMLGVLFVIVFMLGPFLRLFFGRAGAGLSGGIAGIVAYVFTGLIVVAVIAGIVAMVAGLVTGTGGRRRRGSGLVWYGGGWGSGGGFSGGGGSFGGGGASGSW